MFKATDATFYMLLLYTAKNQHHCQCCRELTSMPYLTGPITSMACNCITALINNNTVLHKLPRRVLGINHVLYKTKIILVRIIMTAIASKIIKYHTKSVLFCP